MEFADYLRFAAALVFVLGLIGLCAMIAKRFGLNGYGPGATTGKRLHLIERLPLDGRHHLVLVRRDTCEHLLVLGPSTPVVVEADIDAPAPPLSVCSPDQPAGKRAAALFPPGPSPVKSALGALTRSMSRSRAS